MSSLRPVRVPTEVPLVLESSPGTGQSGRPLTGSLASVRVDIPVSVSASEQSRADVTPSDGQGLEETPQAVEVEDA